MDADHSHDPREIPACLQASEDADLVLGTRYKGGIRVINWPLSRLLISMFAGKFVRAVTALPVSDPTGGYKCYRAEVLEAIGLERIASNGYSFQIETSFEAWRRGFRIAEVPIVFEDRRAGKSKFSREIAREAFFMVFRLAWRNRVRRPVVRSFRGGRFRQHPGARCLLRGVPARGGRRRLFKVCYAGQAGSRQGL